MKSSVLKALLSIWIEVLIGFFILLWDFRYFCFYAFVVILWTILLQVDFLRKILRVFHIANEVKLMAIVKDLDIEDKVHKELDDLKKGMTDKAWEELESEFASISDQRNLK